MWQWWLCFSLLITQLLIPLSNFEETVNSCSICASVTGRCWSLIQKGLFSITWIIGSWWAALPHESVGIRGYAVDNTIRCVCRVKEWILMLQSSFYFKENYNMGNSILKQSLRYLLFLSFRTTLLSPVFKQNNLFWFASDIIVIFQWKCYGSR